MWLVCVRPAVRVLGSKMFDGCWCLYRVRVRGGTMPVGVRCALPLRWMRGAADMFVWCQGPALCSTVSSLQWAM